MIRSALAVALLSLSLAAPVEAALPVGAKAPLFVAPGALGGRSLTVNLRQLLRRGPVVLYFFPKSFTPGCTLEAHLFAEAAGDFRRAGATVIGMSADDVTTLKRFSTKECRSKFPVANASPALIKDYDVALDRPNLPAGMTDRVSYVIAPDGHVALVHADMDPKEHVKLTLAAVKRITGK